MIPMRVTITYLIFLLVFTVSCHDQTEVSPTKKNTAQKIQVTSLSQEPQLERVLDAAGFLSSGLSGRTNGSGLEIDVEHIIKLLQADSVYSSYAFGIDQNTSSSGFSNLIIEEFEQGYLGFIVSYEPSTIFTGMPSFTGKVKRNTLDGRLISEMEFENGEFIQFRPTADRNGKVLLVGQCLADVEVTTECTPSKTTSTATGLPNEHIQDCVTVTTYYYEYCDIPDPWGNYIIGGLGSGPIGSGNTGGIPTSGGSNTTGTPTYSDDVNAGNNIVPIINPTKPKNVPVIEPEVDVWPADLVLNLPSAGDIITDVTVYLKCFNLNSGAKVTIYVDQPTANSRDTWSGGITNPDVGHTFVSIQQGSITRVLGFYPSQGVNPFTSPSAKSALVDDSNHPYDLSVEITVTSAQLSSIINLAKNSPKNYNLNTYNCTDFGSQISAAAGFSIKNTDGTWPGGGGSNPGDFGQDLRAMSSTANAKINKAAGTASSNAGTCK